MRALKNIAALVTGAAVTVIAMSLIYSPIIFVAATLRLQHEENQRTIDHLTSIIEELE